MNKTRIILRFDDVCETIDPLKWKQVMDLLIKLDIKPILAVIPNNNNPEFQVANPDPMFWDDMLKLEGLGWTIALHGYDHVYITKRAGLLGITPRSEFAGVSYAEQERKIVDGVKVFESHGIKPHVWVAPAHSFDLTTIKILKRNGFDVVSDGLSDFAYTRYNMKWVPCQLWDLTIPQKTGIFTVCIHLFKMSNDEIDRLCNEIVRNKDIIVDLDYALDHIRGTGFIDRGISILKSYKRILKGLLR